MKEFSEYDIYIYFPIFSIDPTKKRSLKSLHRNVKYQ